MNSIYSICIIQNSSLNIFLGGAKEDTNIYIQLIEGLNLFNKSTKNNIKRKSNFSFLILKNKKITIAESQDTKREAGLDLPNPNPTNGVEFEHQVTFFGIRNDLEFLLEQSNSNVPKWHVPSRNVHVAHVSEWWYTVRRRIGQSASSGNDGRTANTNPADSRGTRPRDQIIRVTNRIRQWQRWQRKAWFLILSRKFLFFHQSNDGDTLYF